MANHEPDRGIAYSRLSVGLIRCGLVIACALLVLIALAATPSSASVARSAVIEETETASAMATRTRLPTWTRTLNMFTRTLVMLERTAVVRISTAQARPYNQRFYLTATALAEGGEILVEGQSGTLNDRLEGYVTSENARVKIKNGIVSVRVYNTEKRLGYFGLMFRDENDPEVSLSNQYRLMFSYRGGWYFGYGLVTYRSGSVARLDRTPHGFNDILLIFKDDVAILFLNGDYITKLNVGKVQAAGDVSVYAQPQGYKPSHQLTYFDRFTVVELP